MLKHGRVFPRTKAWTMRYLIWLQEQKFDHPAHQIALQEMVEAVRVSKERVRRLEAAIEEFLPRWTLAPVVQALQALRGVDLIVAVTFATEIGDLGRFENPRQLMGYLGLVPSERSTGESIRSGFDHQGREWARAPYAGRERLDLSSSGSDRGEEALQIGGDLSQGPRDCLEGADPAHGSLPGPQREGQEDKRRLYGHRSRAGWLHVVGRPGGATNLTATPS
jgi:hypothetical protein